MKETIADMRKRYVYVPRDPEPNKLAKDAFQNGHNQGWNDCIKYLKAVGKL